MSVLPSSKIYQHVKQSEVSSGPDLDTRVPRKNAWTKLGTFNLLAMVASSIATLIAVAFLTFTWYGASRASRGHVPSALWLKILDKQWMTRVVTVCAILIRVACSTQMGVFAAVVAAIVLETTGVVAEQLALISVVRSVNNGPRSHLGNAFSSVRSGVRLGYVAIILVAFFNLVALQFTSTLLLGDFNPINIVLGTEQETLAFGVTALPNGPGDTNAASSYELSSTGIDAWRTGPSTYVRFAEFAQPPSVALDYVDTGSALRAYVPLRSPDARSAIRNFSGPATVFDSRVICVPPVMTLFGVKMSGSEVSLYFNLTMNGSFPGLILGVSLVQITHICGAETVWDNTSSKWGLTMCDVSSGSGAVDMDVATNPNISRASPRSYLVLNTTGGLNWPESFLWTPDMGVDASAGAEWQQTTSGPWRNIFTTVNGLDVGLNASLCIANPATVDYLVDIYGEDHISEPSLSWNVQQRSYDVDDIRNLLGAVAEPPTLRERGIYNLQPPSIQDAQSTMSYTLDSIYSTLYWRFSMSNTGWGFNETADAGNIRSTIVFENPSNANSLHVTHDAIFTQTLKKTSNPALALQALNTVLTQVMYYDALPRFEISGPAQYRTVSSVNVPARWTGFTVIMVLLATHFIVVIAAIAVFLLTTEHSQLGSTWQAVAQMTSAETSDILDHVADMSDKEARRYLERKGKDQSEVVLAASIDSGRSEVVFRGRS